MYNILYPLCIYLAAQEIGGFHDKLMEGNRGIDARDSKALEGGFHTLDSLSSVLVPDDELCEQRIIKGGPK